MRPLRCAAWRRTLRLLIGLRLAVDEHRPLPYSTRFCAERCGLYDQAHASRVLRELERAGVIERDGALTPRGKPDGTKLYRAPCETGGGRSTRPPQHRGTSGGSVQRTPAFLSAAEKGQLVAFCALSLGLGRRTAPKIPSPGPTPGWSLLQTRSCIYPAARCEGRYPCEAGVKVGRPPADAFAYSRSPTASMVSRWLLNQRIRTTRPPRNVQICPCGLSTSIPTA